MASIRGFTDKSIAFVAVLIRHPGEIPYLYRWWKSLLPGHSNFADELPWITFRAIDFIESRIDFGSVVFEYGAGASTLFYAKRTKQVIAVEHDQQWCETLRKYVSDKRIENVELIYIPPKSIKTPDDQHNDKLHLSFQPKYEGLSFKDYVRVIDRYPDDHFDLVSVDGRARAACLERAFKKVKTGGFVLLDNSERPEYQQAASKFNEFDRYDYFGVVPANYVPYQTTIWQKAAVR